MGLFKTRIHPYNNTVLYDGTEPNTITINNGGANYAVNDIITIDGFAIGGEACICKVAALTGNAVATLTILSLGYGYSVANGYTTTTVTGIGSGLILNITALRTRNSYFAHAKYGSDTNAGTRINPFATVTKLLGYYNTFYNVYSGNSTENITLLIAGVYTGYIVFENESSVLNCTGFWYGGHRYNIKCNIMTGSSGANSIYNSYISNYYSGNLGNNSSYNFINESRITSGLNLVNIFNNTILTFKNYSTNNYIYNIHNTIIVDNIDLHRFSSQTTHYPKFYNSLFRKATNWKWNNAIISITYGVASTFLEDVWNGLDYYCINTLTSTNQTYMRLMLGNSFAECLIFNSTCKVIDDAVYPIFNKYNGTTVIDYTLLTLPTNEALYMGNTTYNMWVGAYRPNIAGEATSNPMVFGSVINVNADNTDDNGTTADLLSISNGVIYLNSTSEQTRNRIRTNVIRYPRNSSTFGAQTNVIMPTGGNYSFGKNRPLDLYNQPQNTIEVVPYDNLTTPSSTIAKFSVSMNGETKLYYLLSTGAYLTFNDLANLGITTDINLTYFGNYIVTTSDIEDDILSAMTTLVSTRNIPCYYAMIELNINYLGT